MTSEKINVLPVSVAEGISQFIYLFLQYLGKIKFISGHKEKQPFILYHFLFAPTLSLVLFIDKFRVEQIIRNLINNAAEFTPEGGNVTIRFLVCSEEDLKEQQYSISHLEALSPESVTGFSAETLSVTTRLL